MLSDIAHLITSTKGLMSYPTIGLLEPCLLRGQTKTISLVNLQPLPRVSHGQDGQDVRSLTCEQAPAETVKKELAESEVLPILFPLSLRPILNYSTCSQEKACSVQNRVCDWLSKQ